MKLKCVNCEWERSDYETSESDWYYCPECNNGRIILVEDGESDFLIALTLGIFLVASLAIGLYITFS